MIVNLFITESNRGVMFRLPVEPVGKWWVMTIATKFRGEDETIRQTDCSHTSMAVLHVIFHSVLVPLCLLQWLQTAFSPFNFSTFCYNHKHFYLEIWKQKNWNVGWAQLSNPFFLVQQTAFRSSLMMEQTKKKFPDDLLLIKCWPNI